MSSRTANRILQNAHRKRLIYGEDGKTFSYRGYAQVMWSDHGDLIKVFGGIVGLCLAYIKVTVYVEEQNKVAFRQHLKQRQEDMGSSNIARNQYVAHAPSSVACEAHKLDDDNFKNADKKLVYSASSSVEASSSSA